MTVAALIAQINRARRLSYPRIRITVMVFRDNGTIPVRIAQ